ncbi:putative cell envelope-related transcriptional attenuator [Actinoplanes missouriensis 431]|uniref:Putative cell envelope-related transcriptional attenuator n=1 Tax=Actinoplanes missouriensis (strain ATCC 14538 / DSM 43046 / CBS 188.64 / JCM 3121 / NBRC 102363 / NCIMB 12654 / NRRL B-3342 / UNCC 431) TaxID=512565 RepID=I0GYS7_ACTM4|nr:LCP family protein [Actinoplanes missouriensis]BAL85914.1 putative cell envelope-related transcriptional attenuator [Actinoplanes missouriensis 431]
MRNSKITWAVIAGAVVALLAGVGVAIAMNRSSTETAAPSSSAAASLAVPSPSVEATPSASPGADIKGPLDLVLVGVDTRVSIPGWEPHADTVMLLHVDAGLDSAYLYSLPRDLRVDMPAYKKSGFSGGRYKLTEAMSRGSRIPGEKTKKSTQQGYELLTRSLSDYTGIKEFQAGAVLTFAGLSKLVDALGGIDMTIDQKVKSRHHKPDGTNRPIAPGGGDHTGPQMVYQPGKRHLVGWQATDYARQRYGLPNGDYDRQRHQRQMVSAILTKALSQDVQEPEKLREVIEAVGESLVYVGGRTPFEYAYALRDLTPAKITLVDLPGAGVSSGGRYLGEQLKPEGTGFLKALVKGKAEAYLSDHPKLVNRL